MRSAACLLRAAIIPAGEFASEEFGCWSMVELCPGCDSSSRNKLVFGLRIRHVVIGADSFSR